MKCTALLVLQILQYWFIKASVQISGYQNLIFAATLPSRLNKGTHPAIIHSIEYIYPHGYGPMILIHFVKFHTLT